MATAEYHRKWREKNREKARASWRKCYAKNREKYLADVNARNAANRTEVNARNQANSHKRAGIVPTRPQPRACECCARKPKIALCADHDHLTGEFRGWLCTACNKAIGSLDDTLSGVLKAVSYLQRYLENRK